MSLDAPRHSSDEFRFLQSDADSVGLSGPMPKVRRVSVPLPDWRQLSTLHFDGPASEQGVAQAAAQYHADEQPVEFVLLHGMGLNAHSFDPTVLALGRPALSIDLAGHGRSDWRSDAHYRPELLAADVVVALETLAPGPVVLVGHSLGALTAIVVAALRPEAIRRLVLVDLTPGVTPASDAAGVSAFIAGQRTFDSIDEIVDRAIDFEIGSDRAALTRGVALNTRVRPDGKLEWTHHFAHLLPDPAGAAGETGEAATPQATPPAQPYASLWAPLEAVTAPVALVRGTTGMVSSAMLGEWHERLPGASVTDLETGHNVHEQDPVGLARVLAKIALQVTSR